MHHRIALIILAIAAVTASSGGLGAGAQLLVGVAAVPITPFGQNPDWDGTVTQSGVWGELFTDSNQNGRWNPGEPFEDDPVNSSVDPSSLNKYDGIFLAGFGNNRLATGKHDDLWARVIVLECGPAKIAFVSLDVIGYYTSAAYYGLNEVRKLLDPGLGIQEILVSSTHTHEGPDTIGPWGTNMLSDGKYPRYLRFVDRQIARAIRRAAASVSPCRMRAGRTDSRLSPSIADMQTRTSGRPPKFCDDEMQVLQFSGIGGNLKGKTIATLVNWSTHPESMEDQNTLLTSDFPHAVRETLEKKYGGLALYFSGDLGAVEIVGDTRSESGQRTSFDGRDYPLSGRSEQDAFTFERTEAIGRDVARAASDAIARSEPVSVRRMEIRKANVRAPMDNAGYLFLVSRGVLDALKVPADGSAPQVETSVYSITLGSVGVLTTPGELFPELFYGVTGHGRTDCPQADTGRPREPAVRDHMKTKYRLIIGMCPDEMGYLVPGYDFLKPQVDMAAMAFREAADPCRNLGVPDHYHETNAASSMLGPAWTCAAVGLLDGKDSASKACAGLSGESK